VNGFHQIELGGGDQDFVHVPARRVDASPAPTVEVFDHAESVDSADRALVASAAATLDAYDQALATISGLGTTAPRRILVNGTTAVIGRRYSLEDEGGQAEIVTCVGRAAGFVEAAAPLSSTYSAASSRLRGLELGVTIPEAVAALEELLEHEHPIAFRWVYYIGGQRVTVTEQGRFVRSKGHATYVGEVEAMLREEWPELVQLLGSRPSALGSLVAGSARKLGILMRAHDIDPDTILPGPHGVEILRAHCVWQFGMRGLVPRNGADPTTWVDWARADYLNVWNAFIKGRPGRDVVEPDRTSDQAPAGHSRRRRNLISPK
jgi:hypothetical protein